MTGDPLTPYKRVFDVVRGGYDEVAPKGLVVLKRTSVRRAVSPTAAGVAPKAAAAGQQRREVDGTRVSVAAGGRQFWDRHVGDPAGWDRAGWQSHSRVRHDQGSQSRVGHQRSRSATESPRFGHDTSGQHRTGFGGGSGHGGQYGRDSGQRGGQSGDPRR